jgi:hypothetical protein
VKDVSEEQTTEEITRGVRGYVERAAHRGSLEHD